MGNKVILLARVKSGELHFCQDCKAFHLIFNNLFFAFTPKELDELRSYVNGLEVDYWEHKYGCTNLVRKIPIPTSQENLALMFNRQEVSELKTLLAFDKNSKMKVSELLNICDIDYNFILN
ncbi:DUF6686 family protein [Winogradskyella sp. PG-2]|uniref:DUF6686 family protein n=1 Tax=Winogradskyella sp. PG-2 TaxID=754409 RepID=UPI0004586103|nr:DUF6686 family protein [Winogradskyella sp. PG-2]BAO74683.1 hypothetical protein WPG_0453 [Winogradskyella sp. PG-2]